MTSNFRDFARALDRVVGDMLAEPILRAKQDLAITVLTRIVERTPAVTGHARANWQVSIGGSATGIVAGADPSGATALAAGVTAIMGDRDPFATVWIANNAPYIQSLEQGDSTQAPAGMVAQTVAELGRAG